MKTLVRCIMRLFSGLAMSLAVSSVTSACHFFTYQPDVPEELKKYEV